MLCRVFLYTKASVYIHVVTNKYPLCIEFFSFLIKQFYSHVSAAFLVFPAFVGASELLTCCHHLKV